MAALAADPRIHCKLSGLLTEVSPAQLADPLAVLGPVVGRLLDWFGPERLIWGSDWPVLNLAGDYALWRSLTDQLLAELTDDERAAIMGGNAARFYGISL
ncbi:amidohydrolase family protein [Paracoccus cavernae]|uniref:Amidohydrolase family protein n=2 Tax=Paracoccus cavernae TaxID=1571207 RepID=A0ABT8D8M1_9RHOB|nr:amidohydrolase family protein [Paracoccus cavernae]